MCTDNSPWLVAVHGGAGYHSTNPASEKAVKHALRVACIAAFRSLEGSNTGQVDAVEHAICSLENAECLNAGRGSNLTFDGEVECDASIMDGEAQHFGSVGAIQGVKNPISVARAVMENSKRPQPLGRVPPLTLVGRGAHSFALTSGLETADSNDLITDAAKRAWRTWRVRLAEAGPADSRIPPMDERGPEEVAECSDAEEERAMLEDTVGAVACDAAGRMAAGVSSGGLLLKHAGRVGEAAVFGAGVWADAPLGAPYGVAVSVSGTGEDIVRASLARALADALRRARAAPSWDAHDAIRGALEEFCAACTARGQEEPSAGVLVVTKELVDSDSDDEQEEEEEDSEGGAVLPIPSSQTDDTCTPGDQGPPSTRPISLRRRDTPEKRASRVRLRLWCAFTTPSMALAYASSADPVGAKPRALILRQPDGRRTAGRVCIVALPFSRS